MNNIVNNEREDYLEGGINYEENSMTPHYVHPDFENQKDIPFVPSENLVLVECVDEKSKKSNLHLPNTYSGQRAAEKRRGKIVGVGRKVGWGMGDTVPRVGDVIMYSAYDGQVVAEREVDGVIYVYRNISDRSIHGKYNDEVIKEKGYKLYD